MTTDITETWNRTRVQHLRVTVWSELSWLAVVPTLTLVPVAHTCAVHTKTRGHPQVLLFLPAAVNY